MYPQGNQPPAAQPAPEQDQEDMQQSGLRQVDTGFNQDVQNVLLSRIQTLTPEEGKALDAVITPQTLPVFLKILPELKPLFDMMANNGAQNYVSTPQPGADAEDDEEDDNQQQNPLVSQGLVG